MCGLIWTIQIVHYPFFKFINNQDFYKAHIFHQQKISFIVVPLMLIELSTGIYILYLYLESNFLFYFINLLIIFIIWATTFFIMVPIHKTLLLNNSIKNIKKLIFFNWIRTISWSLKSILLLYLLYI